MSAPLLYLLQANLLLLLFAAVYYGLLRRLTFFGLNRAYLLLALGLAAVGPALPVPGLFAHSVMPLPAVVRPLLRPIGVVAGPVAARGIDWPTVLLAVYAAGAGLLLLRLLGQGLALAQLHRRSRPVPAVAGFHCRELPTAAGPFSFWQTMYLNPDPAAAPAVLRHEAAHLRQWHTLDVLLAQVATALAWPNPAAWLLRRAVLHNLEFLADRAALQSGLDRRAYQYELLRQHPAGSGVALTSAFTFLTLKNRVAMMNTPTSAAGQKARYFLALPLLVLLPLGFSAGQSAKPAPSSQMANDGLFYYVDGRLSSKDRVDKIAPEDIASMDVLDAKIARQILGSTGADGTVIITTKNNEHAPDVLAFNAKIARVAPLVPGTETPNAISGLMPAALAYITKNYPDSRITDVKRIDYPTLHTSRYRVEIAAGRRPQTLLFDEKGNRVEPGSTPK